MKSYDTPWLLVIVASLLPVAALVAIIHFTVKYW